MPRTGDGLRGVAGTVRKTTFLLFRTVSPAFEEAFGMCHENFLTLLVPGL